MHFVGLTHAEPWIWCGDLNVAPHPLLDLASSASRFWANDVPGCRPDEQVSRGVYGLSCAEHVHQLSFSMLCCDSPVRSHAILAAGYPRRFAAAASGRSWQYDLARRHMGAPVCEPSLVTRLLTRVASDSDQPAVAELAAGPFRGVGVADRLCGVRAVVDAAASQ